MTEDDEIREGGGKIAGIIILAVVLAIAACAGDPDQKNRV